MKDVGDADSDTQQYAKHTRPVLSHQSVELVFVVLLR